MPGDHVRVAHPGHAALRPDVGRHPLQRHHGDRARVLGDLRLVGVDHVHDHAALEHLGHPALHARGAQLRAGGGTWAARRTTRCTSLGSIRVWSRGLGPAGPTWPRQPVRQRGHRSAVRGSPGAARLPRRRSRSRRATAHCRPAAASAPAAGSAAPACRAPRRCAPCGPAISSCSASTSLARAGRGRRRAVERGQSAAERVLHDVPLGAVDPPAGRGAAARPASPAAAPPPARAACRPPRRRPRPAAATPAPARRGPPRRAGAAGAAAAAGSSTAALPRTRPGSR